MSEGHVSTAIRQWRRDDATALARLANDRQVWLGLRDLFPHPYSLDVGAKEVADAPGQHAFITLATGTTPTTLFATEVDGVLAGGIGYLLRTDVERIGAEVGYWLGREFWGRGIGTAALRLLTARAFAAHPELRRLFAVPFASNAASARVLEKAGYVREGIMRQSVLKDGRVLDQFMYGIVRDDVEANR